MITRARLSYIRISPRKFRQIIPLVKGKNAQEAIAILASVKKGASKYAIDLLKSAIANARRLQGVDVSKLYISRLIADCGPTMKRFRAASMGRASTIHKRTSHITLELDEIKELAASNKELKGHELKAKPQAKPGREQERHKAEAAQKLKKPETKKAHVKEPEKKKPARHR